MMCDRSVEWYGMIEEVENIEEQRLFVIKKLRNVQEQDKESRIRITALTLYQPWFVGERNFIRKREGSNAGGCGRSLQLGGSVGAYY
jgi:hypothetical protein